MLLASLITGFKADTDLLVSMTEPLQHRVIVFNTAKAPTNDLQNRKVMIHAVDKAAIIEKELAGLDEPVDSLFSKKAPYCHVDLTPKWDYDFEKATLLNCPPGDSDSLPTYGIIVIAFCSVLTVSFGTVIMYMKSREEQGKPVFEPLMQSDPDSEL